LNAGTEFSSRSAVGRLFQTEGAEKLNNRSDNLDRAQGTTRRVVSAVDRRTRDGLKKAFYTAEDGVIANEAKTNK